MVVALLNFISTLLIQLVLGGDCWVPGANILKFEVVSDTNTDVLDSNYKFLRKASLVNINHPQWPLIQDSSRIWDQVDNQNLGIKYFKIDFEIIGTPIFGYLITGCDDYITAYINGNNIGCGSGNHLTLVSCDILRFLKSGYNYAIFQCNNSVMLGYLAYKLSLESEF